MKFSQVMPLLDETNLSPERLAKILNVSNSTYRRWQKVPANKEFPSEYKANLAAGIYKLLTDGVLSYDSPKVNKFLEGNLPEFFEAASGRFIGPADLFSESSKHQDKVTAVLSNLGNSTKIRGEVDESVVKIRKFEEWGSAWKYRIKLLLRVITMKDMTLVDRLVAYGALFYLIFPFDLIPDSIPVFGYVDDFGILGFAAAYYCKRYPHIFAGAQEGIE